MNNSNEKKIEVKNKIESINKIEELGLNKFAEELFYAGEEAKILDFINKYPAKYYALRDKTKPGGIFKLKVLKEDVLDEISQYDVYSINVSSANFSSSQILVGEICIKQTGEIYLTVSTNKDYSVRDALRNPDFNLVTDIFDDKGLNKIPCFDYLFDYIDKNKLYDVIVEFSLFDIDVGVKGEKIVVYELRTHY